MVDSYIWIVVICLSVAPTDLSGERSVTQRVEEAGSFTLDQAQEVIWNLIGDPEYPLTFISRIKHGNKGYWTFSGLKVGAFVDTFEVDPDSGIVTQALLYSRRDSRHNLFVYRDLHSQILIPRDYAERKARRLARENFHEFDRLPLDLVVNAEPRGSILTFKWRSTETNQDGSPRYAISLGLDTFNGRLTVWRATRPPIVPGIQAGIPETEPEASFVPEGHDEEPVGKTETVPSFVYPNDAWPSWSPRGQALVFTSDRLYFPLHPDPELGAIDASRNHSLIVSNEGQKSLQVLVHFYEDQPSLFPTWSPTGDRIAFSAGDMVYDVHLETGELRTHTQPQREGKVPSWNSTGTLLAMYGERSHGDTDVFVADTARSLRDSRGQWRVAQQEGFDYLPTFHPREPWLVYVHESMAEDQSSSWDLYRVAAEKPYWENEPPRKIVEDLPEPGRLSWFPDGQRLLVWHEKGLEVVDVAASKRTPLALPPLHDPDFPEGPPLELRDVVIDPTGTKLTFSSLRWSGRPQDDAGWYLYVCALDGSGLQRITPVEDEVVPLYQFPQTEKTAADLAAEILQTLE